MKYILLSISFLFISPVATAEVTVGCYEFGIDYSRHDGLVKELKDIRGEFGYYANKFNDDSRFPKARAQELLQNFETNYLMQDYFTVPYPYQYGEDNPLGYVANLAFAKLLLSYDGDLFLHDEYDEDFDKNPLILLVERNNIDDAPDDIPDLPHDKISYRTRNYDIGFERRWNLNLPDSNVRALMALYLSLGARIDFTDEMGGNAIISSSLYWLDYETELDMQVRMEERRKELERLYTVPDEKHRADDIRKPCDIYIGDRNRYYVFYRTPITYWLEEFIEADYPVSMLDTHKLHYPRFMKEASVAEVMDMLNNSDAHKIPANINCPYQRKQGAGDEVAQAVSPAELCPLIPSVNMRDAMGRTPLHIAGEQGNKAVFDALINIGADESIKDYRGNLPHY